MSRRLPVVAAPQSPRRSSLLAAPVALAEAPAAATGAATSIGARSAIVSGRVDPGGESTTWYVEYGDDHGLRLPQRGAERGQRDLGRRRARSSCRGLATGCHVPLPRRRHRTRTARAAAPDATLPDAGRPRSRRRRAGCDRPVVGEPSAGRSIPTGGRRAGGSSTAPDEPYGIRTETRSAGAGVSAGRRLAAARAASRAGVDVPLPRRGRERHRHDARRRPVASARIRPRPSRPARRRRHHDLLGAR